MQTGDTVLRDQCETGGDHLTRAEVVNPALLKKISSSANRADESLEDARWNAQATPYRALGLFWRWPREVKPELVKTYVINLPESGDRLRMVASRLSAEGVEFERWPGVLVPEQLGTYLHLLNPTFAAEPDLLGRLAASPGTLGCALAHFALWNAASGRGRLSQEGIESTGEQSNTSACTTGETGGDHYLLVLEDDVKLSPKAIHFFNTYIQSTPSNWDAINLSACLAYGAAERTEEGVFFRAVPTSSEHNLWTSAMAFRNRSLPKLLALVKEHYGAPRPDVPSLRPLNIDQFLCLYSDSLSYYILPESCKLASQHSHLESIRNQRDGS
ncbi:hypothetical protein CYMTET_18911 [Cymbomonas tetramitiformis]|uniref:Uncharacterized protein n=1 Tax=Cymbomonas tetramitiformis TaxID=36881 RepID=A0AAE0L5E7_9CHLO|nr:hypothetical protein CYMTET_18911 [Cymbomonas tetramitiformis]